MSENDKVFNEEKYQSASSLTVPMQPSTDSNITAAPIFFSFSEDQIELNSAESNGNIFDKDEALKVSIQLSSYANLILSRYQR